MGRKNTKSIDSLQKEGTLLLQSDGIFRGFFSSKIESSSNLNVYLLIKTCEYLEIPYYITDLTQMNLCLDTIKSPDEWALNITKSLNADIYVMRLGEEAFLIAENLKRLILSCNLLNQIFRYIIKVVKNLKQVYR